MSLKTKLSFILLAVFLIIGTLLSFSLIKSLKNQQFARLQEENQRIVKYLSEGFFKNLEDWNKSQIVEGPYSFGKTSVKQAQEKFVEFFEKLAGNQVLLFNIYNGKGVIIASNFKELEGFRPQNKTVEKILLSGGSLSEISSAEEIHVPSLGILKNKKLPKEIFEIYQPIEIENQIVGVIESYFIPKIMPRRHLAEMAVIVGSGFVLALFIIYFFFNRFILRPLEIIGRATEPVSRGEFSGYIKDIKQKDEIGRLAENFNLMIRGLNNLSGEITRLKDIGRMKSEFISIVAHQLRTPLSGIKWVVEILLEKTTNGESRKWVLKINELNERMIEIISDLLNAARIEEGRLGFEFKKIDLISLLQKIADEYKIKAEQKKIKFDYSNLPTAIAINADAEKLEIALSNLIENAVDYTPSGGVIKIEIQKNEELVLLKISDSGIGIPKEDFPRLFTKFFRSKNAISAKPAGTGIGLFVAKNIIQNHKGEVWAESELEKGSIFYVKLPLLSLSSA